MRATVTGQRRGLDLGSDITCNQLHAVGVGQDIPDELVHMPQGGGARSRVASGIRCKSDRRGSGFMVMLGGGTDILSGVTGLAGGDGAWP